MKVAPEIESLVAYVPGQPIGAAKRNFGLERVIKLASNENALGASPRVGPAIAAHLNEIHLYPDPGAHDLTQTLAQQRSWPASGIVLGNGSNELIDLLIRVFCTEHDCILTSEAAFAAYRICAQAARVRTVTTPMTSDHRFSVSELISAYHQHQPKLVFIANPNNPTGTYLTQAEMEQLLAVLGNRDDVLVVIDEAYGEYVRASDFPAAMELARKYANIVVSHTFSKVYGLAALRLGVLYAPERVANYLHRVRNPFNVNSLAQVAGLAAVEDSEHLRASTEMVWQGMDWLTGELAQMGLVYLPSQTNFILFDSRRDGDKLASALTRRGILLRPVGTYGFKSHLRWTIGRADENRAALSALQQALTEIEPMASREASP